ncbi:EamA family transporter [Bacillus salacetis]|uniref:EamA family transporter n=1 Tax=Bacillus salacetis TaxID=2315464 RepID=A0A3A1QVG0_9BACI|nr:EamA family transporter [Bacillus salacetis]RIW31974.1 EamA family transporter [Bacillus salacetis]
MQRKHAPLLILLAAVLWGTTGAQALAPRGADPLVIGAVRLAFGGIPLLILILVMGKVTFRNWPIRETFAASISMACYQPLFFSAVSMTGVAVGTVIAIGSAPVLSGALEWIFLKKSPARVWWTSTVLSIIGCILLFMNKESVTVDPFGILLALGAGLSFAAYSFVSGKLVERHSSISIVAVVFTLRAVMLSPLLFLYDLSWIGGFRGLAVSLHLGLVTTGVSYYLFAKGLLNVPSSTGVTLALAEPLTAALLGVFFIGERLAWTSWLGIGLLLFGIGILIFDFKKKDVRNEISLEI